MRKMDMGASVGEKDFNIDYFLGKDIHFTVLTHAKELLKMCPFIQEKQTLNDLSKIEDSVMLLTILKEMGKLVKLYPHRMTYPDPNS